MNSSRTIPSFPMAYVLLFLVLIVALVSTSVGQNPSKEAPLPLAEQSLRSTDENATKLRRKRSGRHDLGDKTIDPRPFQLTEESPEVVFPLPDIHAKPEPAFPVSDSDTIIVGEVKDAAAYLSNDQTSLYSEFLVAVDQIIKGGTETNAGSCISVQRPGGRLKLHSGKELTRGAPFGRNMPHTGRRYVLFLRADREAEVFALLTGYELSNGVVYPLDRGPAGEKPFSQFAEYEKYAGVSEAIFFAHLQLALNRR